MKVLVIRFSSIGDIVLTSPVVRAIKNQAGAEIHFVTKKSFEGILSVNPNIDKVYSFEKDLSEILPELKTNHYDFIADLHNNLRSLRVKSVLRRPSRSVDKLNFRKWLLVNLKINRMPPVHIVDRYFDVVKPIGVKNDGLGLDFFIPPEKRINKNDLPETHRENFVAFVIGAKHNTKQLPEEKIISICKKISEPVTLLGGPEDAERGSRIASASGPHVFNAAGKFSLHGSADLLEKSRVVISHDTGLMHIAAALKKKYYICLGQYSS